MNFYLETWFWSFQMVLELRYQYFCHSISFRISLLQYISFQNTYYSNSATISMSQHLTYYCSNKICLTISVTQYPYHSISVTVFLLKYLLLCSIYVTLSVSHSICHSYTTSVTEPFYWYLCHRNSITLFLSPPKVFVTVCVAVSLLK